MGLPLNAIVEVSFNTTYASQRYLNIRHLRVSVPVPAGTTVQQEMEALLDALTLNAVGSYRKTFLGLLSSSHTLTSMRVQPVRPTRQVFFTRNINVPGENVGVAPTGNIAAVLTFKTLSAGRDQIGSFHMPGVPADVLVQGRIDNAYAALLDGLGLVLTSGQIVAATGGEYLPVIFHRNATIVPPSDDIVNWIVQSTARTMRRRTVGVGK